MLQLHDHLNCCSFSLVLHDHAATPWMIISATAWSCCNQLHLFTKLGGAMCSMVTAWIICVGLDWGYTPHSKAWPSAGNNYHWLADPKATICEPKWIYPALRQQNTRGVIRLLDVSYLWLSWEQGRIWPDIYILFLNLSTYLHTQLWC